MARCEAGVAAARGCLGFAAGVRALCQSGVFAFARAMARFLAGVGAAAQAVAAGLPARDLRRPAGLVLEDLLAAHARLLHEVRAFRTRVAIAVALVVDCGVAASPGPVALVGTRGWLGATWERRVQDCSAAVARDLIEDGFATGTACAAVAEFLAGVFRVSAF